MRIKYNGFLLSDATAQLKRFPLPEPPSDEEMAAELAGMERLEEALESGEDDRCLDCVAASWKACTADCECFSCQSQRTKYYGE